MNRDEKIDYERWYHDVQEAIEEAHYRYTRFSEATTPVDQAYALVNLNDAISDLASWHSSYDINDGLLDWQREDR